MSMLMEQVKGLNKKELLEVITLMRSDHEKEIGELKEEIIILKEEVVELGEAAGWL